MQKAQTPCQYSATEVLRKPWRWNMTEVRAITTRKQLHNITHLHFQVRFRRQGVLRFPFGENEALCFAIQYVNETAW